MDSQSARAGPNRRLVFRITVDWTPGWDLALRRAAYLLASLAGLLAIDRLL